MRPALELAMHRAPVSKLGRQVAPSRRRERQPRNRIDKQTVVRRRAATVALRARDERFWTCRVIVPLQVLV